MASEGSVVRVRPLEAPERLSPAAEQAGVERAREVVAQIRAARPAWRPPPFDPRVYAEALGLPVLFARDLAHFDALLVPHPDGPRIVCNASVRSEGRIRFSIAHEIAHLLYEDPDDVRLRMRTEQRTAYEGTEAGAALERLCDRLAAELLMPDPFFADDVAQIGASARGVALLAERYAVSREAAALRLLEAVEGPFAVGFFRWEPPPSARGDPEARRPAYRARRVFRSPGFPLLFPAGKSVPDDSVVYRASLARRELRGTERFALGRVAAVCEVTAFALRRAADPQGPPTVCVTFHSVGA